MILTSPPPTYGTSLRSAKVRKPDGNPFSPDCKLFARMNALGKAINFNTLTPSLINLVQNGVGAWWG
jgi:hypothetical protein